MDAFKDKVVIVTGAGTGIGQAIALEFARKGAIVAICGRRIEPLLAVKEQIVSLGASCYLQSADVSLQNEVNTFVSNVLKEFGHIDVLVNNAGLTRDNLCIRMSEEEWDAVLDTNLKGAFLTSKAVARPMMKQRAGAIINIASVVALVGNAGQCNYSASKAGLIAMTKSLAKELASRNIRINAVAPGFIKSQMTDALSAEQKEACLSQIPLAHFGEGEDIAKAVSFLASPDSAYITGQVLSVNGGLFM